MREGEAGHNRVSLSVNLLRTDLVGPLHEVQQRGHAPPPIYLGEIEGRGIVVVVFDRHPFQGDSSIVRIKRRGGTRAPSCKGVVQPGSGSI